MKLNIDIKRNGQNRVQIKVKDSILLPYTSDPMKVSEIHPNYLVLVSKTKTKYSLAAESHGSFVLCEYGNDGQDSQESCRIQSGQIKVMPVGSFMIPHLRRDISPSCISTTFFYMENGVEITTPDGGYQPCVDDKIIGELYIRDTSMKDGIRLINKEFFTRVVSVVKSGQFAECSIQEQISFVGDCGVLTMAENGDRTQVNIDGFVFVPKYVYIR